MDIYADMTNITIVFTYVFTIYDYFLVESLCLYNCAHCVLLYMFRHVGTSACMYVETYMRSETENSSKITKYWNCVCVSVCVFVCLGVCDSGSRTAEPSPQGSPTLGQQSSTSEDIWVLRKPLAGKRRRGSCCFPLILHWNLFISVCLFGGGERSGSVGSIGSLRSSSSLQNSGNTHVLTTPTPSPQPANTPGGVNTHGLNAPGLHAQAEGVKVRDIRHLFEFICSCLLLANLPGNSKKVSRKQDILLTTILFPGQVFVHLPMKEVLILKQ